MINAIQILIMPVSINTSDALLVERHEQDTALAHSTLQDALKAGYVIDQALPFVTGDTAFVWLLLVQKTSVIADYFADNAHPSIGYPDLSSIKPVVNSTMISAVSDKTIAPPVPAEWFNPEMRGIFIEGD